jgi:hypothetical protein
LRGDAQETNKGRVLFLAQGNQRFYLCRAARRNVPREDRGGNGAGTCSTGRLRDGRFQEALSAETARRSRRSTVELQLPKEIGFAAKQRRNRGHQTVIGVGLDQETLRATGDGGERVMRRSVDGEDQDEHARKPEKYLPRRFETIELRHMKIKDDQRWFEDAALFYGILAVGRLAANLPARFSSEQGTKHASDVLIIIDDQNANHMGFRRGPSLAG